MMGTDDNKAVVRRFWQEVFNDGNLDMVDELFVPDHVLHHPTFLEEKQSPNVVKGIVALFRKIVVDLKVSVEDEIAEGEKVVTRWTVGGTVADEIVRARCAGGEMTVSGINVFLVSGGQIRETWMRFDAHQDGVQALVPRDRRITGWLRA